MASLNKALGLLRVRVSNPARLLTHKSVLLRGQQTAAQSAVPEVYTRPPPQPKERKPGQLERWQVDQYFDQGFLLVPGFFSMTELEPVMRAVDECVDIVANMLYDGGKIKDKCEKAGFYKRLTLIDQQFKGASVLIHKLGYLPKAFRDLWSNERLLNAVEQFIGPNIGGHPVWNLRSKTPQNEQATVPWHQDNGYLDPSALFVHQATAWIPLLDTNVNNGCMQMIPEGHKVGQTLTHTCCAGDTWYIDLPENEIKKTYNIKDIEKTAVTCEVPLGGVLFLNNCIPHRSLENFSDKIRWSLDLRWQDPNKPNGFHGLKESIVMRKEDDPDYKIDWEDFKSKDRNKLQAGSVGVNDIDKFDTTIHGPWMLRWEITHNNRHTQALKDSGGSSWHGHKA